MTAIGGTTTITEILPNAGVKMLQVVTASDADAGNTVTVDLSDYGCTNIHGILGFDENTTGSIIITTAPTTTVSSSSLVITVGVGSDDDVRTFIVWAY